MSKNDDKRATHYNMPRPGYGTANGAASTADEIVSSLEAQEENNTTFSVEELEAELEERDLESLAVLSSMIIEYMKKLREALLREMHAKRKYEAAAYAYDNAFNIACHEVRTGVHATDEATEGGGRGRRLTETEIKELATLRCKGYAVDKVMASDALRTASTEVNIIRGEVSAINSLTNNERTLLNTTDAVYKNARSALNADARNKSRK